MFKVDSKTDKGFRFEQTFKVKKICVYEEIIQRFISDNNSSLVSYVVVYYVCNIKYIFFTDFFKSLIRKYMIRMVIMEKE